MNGREIISYLEELYPPHTAESWDNVGLLVGDVDREVERVYLALDLTEEVLEDAIAKRADLVLTHHPMIFQGVKKVTGDDFIGKRIIGLIENKITYYAMHTNYDICRMAELSADYLHLQNREVLEVTGVDSAGNPIGIGRVGTLEGPMKLGEFAEYVKAQLALPQVILYGDPQKEITRGAISTGSGRSMIEEAIRADAQVLVTGDIDHHSGIDAVAKKIAVIDAGHYGTEYIFMEDVKAVLKQKFQSLVVDSAKVAFPYKIV